MRFILIFILSSFSLVVFADRLKVNPSCPKLLTEPPTVQYGRLTIDRGASVFWDGAFIPGFTPERLKNEMALLKYLVARPDQLLAPDKIMHNLFPSRRSDSPEARAKYLNRLIVSLNFAFRDARNFDVIEKLDGFLVWHDQSLSSNLVVEVGSLRVTEGDVFWKDRYVPGFGIAFPERRSALLELVDHAPNLVNASQLAEAVDLQAPNFLPGEEFSRMRTLFTQMQKSFRSVDSEFVALRFDKELGFSWSEEDPIPEDSVVGQLTMRGHTTAIWNGHAVELKPNEMILLRVLSAHNGEALEFDQIMQIGFPALMRFPPRKRFRFVTELKRSLMKAFKDVPNFDTISNLYSYGYVYRDWSIGSALVAEVGNIRVTEGEVFWKGKPVPGLGAYATVERRLLLALLDDVDHLVKRDDLNEELGPEAIESVETYLSYMQTNFLKVDRDFNALKVSACGGKWSERPTTFKTFKIGSLTIKDRRTVTWQGHEVSLLPKVVTFLYFLASHPNRYFDYDAIIQKAFASRMVNPPEVRKEFIIKVKSLLQKAMKEVDPNFNSVINSEVYGYAYSEVAAASREVMRVGNLLLTEKEVFWKDRVVGGFDPDDWEKFGALGILLKNVDRFVPVRDTVDAGLDLNVSKSPTGLTKDIRAIYAEMQRDFELADRTFTALRFYATKGFAWSESGIIREDQNISATGKLRPPTRYRFRGKELDLDYAARAVLELLLVNPPKVVLHDDLWEAILNGRARGTAEVVKQQISRLRKMVGRDAIGTAILEGYYWAAPDRPEIIDPEKPCSDRDPWRECEAREF